MWLRINSNNTLDTKKTMNTRYFSNVIGTAITIIVLALVLQACSGGSDGGATERDASNVVGGGGNTGFTYTGLIPANSEVQSFKREFYDNLVIDGRCGECHTSGGPGPTKFVDRINVNDAWQAAGSVVNFDDPAASIVVQRVANGHNCWLGAGQAATCQATMISYIQNWASGAEGGTSSVKLLPRPAIEPSGTKITPIDHTDTDFVTPNPNPPSSVTRSLHDLLTTYCSGCHRAEAPVPQSPYFASADPQAAYDAVQSKIDLINPEKSRLVVRLRDEQHQCWNNCAEDSELMRLAIIDIAEDIFIEPVNPALLISRAQILMEHGILATSGGRYEDDIIAEWKFSEGINPTGGGCLAGPQCTATTADTSGVQPEIALTLSGEFELLSSGGARFNNGAKAQGLAGASDKLRQMLGGAGEYSIEAWVIPGNVTQEDTSIVSYAGLSENRNFLLGQTLYNYDFYNRSDVVANSAAGGPALSTPDAAELAQATLQHVVLTYDPVNGRRIYVNGILSEVIDEVGGGNLDSWNNSFSLVIGNDASGSRGWSGIVRYVAAHSRALTAEQISKNFDVGIGVNYFLMFSVSELINQDGVCHDGVGADRVNHCYIVFEVGQLDEYAYVFNDPFFVSLKEESFNVSNLTIKGIRVGVNGKLASTGQAFTHVNTTISANDYVAGGIRLADIGTIIPLELGAATDMFFLAFEELNGMSGLVTEPIPAPTAFSYSLSGTVVSDIGVRTFDAINESFAHITGLPSSTINIRNLFTGAANDSNDQGIKRQLPTIADFQTYQASHQTALAQLAIAYCDALVNDNTRRAAFFNNGTSFDFNLRADSVSDNNWRDQVIYPLLTATLVLDGSHPVNLSTQPNRDSMRDTLLNLITNSADQGPYNYNEISGNYESEPDGNPDGLARCNGACSNGRTEEVVKAVCAAVLGSAAVLLQ